eukprot:INCI6322.1.p1 GENE.INCI6322.1~~INCI6322.1.p1  ORF type:complete len:603 (+),score=92.03 INCI6322.1:183-1811(+)
MSEEALVGASSMQGVGPNGDWAPASKKSVTMTVSLAAMGFFLFGYDTGVVSAALYYIAAKQNFGFETFGIEKEVFVSACIAAAILGALLVSSFDKVFGRKTIVLISAALFTVGAALMAVCPTNSFWLMVVGRIIVGLGIGASSSSVPVYISEMAPQEIRGCLTVTNNAFCTGGQMVAALIAYGLSFLDPTMCWRYMLGIGVIPAIAQAIGFSFMPESPRWLLLAGRRSDARAALRRLKRADAGAEAIDAELDYMADALAAERAGTKSGSGACAAICSSPALLRLIFIGSFLQFTQQIAGINTIMYYGSQIVQTALLNSSSNESSVDNGTTSASGTSDDLSDGHTIVLVTAAFGLMNFVFTLVGIYLADRCARRCLTLSSLTLVIVSLAGTGVAFFLEATYVALAGCGVYLAAFAFGMGPMPWTINAELYPLSIRGFATGISTMTNWTSNLLISQFFLSVIQGFSTLFPNESAADAAAAADKGVACSLWTLAFVTLICTAVLAKMLPETGKASLEDIQRKTTGTESNKPHASTHGRILSDVSR